MEFRLNLTKGQTDAQANIEWVKRSRSFYSFRGNLNLSSIALGTQLDSTKISFNPFEHLFTIILVWKNNKQIPLTKEKLSRKIWKKQDFLLLNDTALLYSWAHWLCWSGRLPLRDNWGLVITRVSCSKDWSLVWSTSQGSCSRSALIHVRTRPAKPSSEPIWFLRIRMARNWTSI